MIIQIDGVNTLNKGAELMLIAILEELEKNVPSSTIFLNSRNLDMALIPSYNLNIKQRFFLKNGAFFKKLFSKFGFNATYFTNFYPSKGIDLVIDASGFQYSDQWQHSYENLEIRENYYKCLKSNNTRLILLPQAFGPFQTINGKKSVQIIDKYFDIIFAREQLSYDFLVSAGAKKAKLIRCCDFTLSVEGIFPDRFSHLKNLVCLIPNKKMITHTGSNKDKYINFLNSLINHFEDLSKGVFLLNHEGAGDMQLCLELNKRRLNKLEIVTDISAKEVKGVIGNSYLVISSRFHGVASSLSQAVPCLATSWNHKYEMLFNDFGLPNFILKNDADWKINQSLIENVLGNYEEIVQNLRSKKTTLIDEISSMWNTVGITK